VGAREVGSGSREDDCYIRYDGKERSEQKTVYERDRISCTINVKIPQDQQLHKEKNQKANVNRQSDDDDSRRKQ